MDCSAGCGAGLSCQICSVISQLSKAGKSIVFGVGEWVGGHLQRRRLENVFGQPEQHRRILGRTRPLWHMQQRHNELYYNYKAQSVEVDNIDIWPGEGGGVCCSIETGPLQTPFPFRSL